MDTPFPAKPDIRFASKYRNDAWVRAPARSMRNILCQTPRERAIAPNSVRKRPAPIESLLGVWQRYGSGKTAPALLQIVPIAIGAHAHTGHVRYHEIGALRAIQSIARGTKRRDRIALPPNLFGGAPRSHRFCHLQRHRVSFSLRPTTMRRSVY